MALGCFWTSEAVWLKQWHQHLWVPSLVGQVVWSQEGTGGLPTTQDM